MSPRDLQALTFVWYAKLARANHHDIEARDGTLAYDTGVRRWRAGQRDDLALAMGGAARLRAILPLILDNTDRAIVARLLRGETYREIKAAVGCGSDRIRNALERAERVERDRRERDGRILAMKAAGASYRRIEKALGVKPPTVRAVLVAARIARGEDV